MPPPGLVVGVIPISSLEIVLEENKHHTKVCNSSNLSIAQKKKERFFFNAVCHKSDWITSLKNKFDFVKPPLLSKFKYFF